MATLADSKLVIPGKGHVFYAPVGTEAPVLDNFVFGDETTYGDFVWLGDTSSENTIEFETDGGDVTYKRSWDRTQIRAVREDETINATVNSLNISQETFELAFKGGTYDPATKSYKVRGGGGSAQHALLVVIEDGSDISGFRFPNTDIKGSFPSLDIEEFMEIPLGVAILTDVDMTLWEIFEPRPYVAAVPAG